MVNKIDDDTVVVIDDSDLRKYYLQIPNLIDDLPLHPRSVRLYLKYKRIAAGHFNASLFDLRDTANQMHGMSLGSTFTAKHELLSFNLIYEGEVEIKGVKRPAVFIRNIWDLNNALYNEKVSTFMDRPCSTIEQAVQLLNEFVQLLNEYKEQEEEREEVDKKQSTSSRRRSSPGGQPGAKQQPKPQLLFTDFAFDAETTTWLDGEWRETYSSAWPGLSRDDFDKAVAARRDIFINHWTNTSTKRINWNQQFRLDFTRNGYYEFEAILRRLGYSKQKGNGQGNGRPDASQQRREARAALQSGKSGSH